MKQRIVARLWEVLAPPTFEDEEKTRIARLLHTILLAVTVATLLLTSFFALVENSDVRALLLLFSTTIEVIGIWFIMRRGYVFLSSILLSSLLFISNTVEIYIIGTIKDPIVANYVGAITIASILIGNRAALAFALLSLLTTLAFLQAETAGWLTPTSHPLWVSWVNYAAIIGLVVIFLYLATNGLKKALRRARRNERALQATHTELEQRVNERTAELQKANDELEQFAYVVSHDLKAPLRGIASLTQWIEEDIGADLGGETREYMALLQRRVYRMEALIEGVLQYSRVGLQATETATINVVALLSEVIDLLDPPPDFTIRIESDMPVLKTERVKIAQVFSNLIGNAIKYHHRPDGTISIMATEKGSFYEFAVVDDGPGIAPQFHEKIFGIFQTLQSRDEVESTGVGLALVKKIVEGKGGSITVESAAGQGATFRFTWPKQPGETIATQQNDSPN